jgi:predicted Rossmann fold flavoprotein
MSFYQIAVIGGGPAGMMAAIRAAELTGGVVLFEKNASLGRKLSLTGKGRCNISNDSSMDDFMAAFDKGGPFLRSAFKHFFVPELLDFFRRRGLKFKTERQGRIFPETDSSRSVIEVLIKSLEKEGVEVRLSSPVKNLIAPRGELKGFRLATAQEIYAKKVIFATGGCSYPETGSTGDGFKIASSLAHKIEEPRAGLVSLETMEGFVRDLQGLTLKNIQVTFETAGKKIQTPIGELLFTHFGISGPLVLDFSSKVGLLLKKNKVKACLDLKPGLTESQLDLKLQAEFQQSGIVKLKNYLREILPQRLIAVFLKCAGLDSEKKCHQVTSSERKKIVGLLKRFPLTIKGCRPLSEAMVTCGGISLKEVDPQTMESKKAKGFYFCGEILDLAAASGGYNLQAAFSTGYLAGQSAALSLSGNIK